MCHFIVTKSPVDFKAKGGTAAGAKGWAKDNPGAKRGHKTSSSLKVVMGKSRLRFSSSGAGVQRLPSAYASQCGRHPDRLQTFRVPLC